MVEIYTDLDQEVTLILEKLYRGSVLNYKSFLLKDSIDINAKCATPVTLYYISLEKLTALRIKSPELDEQITELENQMVNKENAIALDYIISKKKRD